MAKDIEMQVADQDVIRFLWLNNLSVMNKDSNVQNLSLPSVPFGSPFLLAATITYHLQQELMSPQRRQRSMKLTLPAWCHHNLNQSPISFHCNLQYYKLEFLFVNMVSNTTVVYRGHLENFVSRPKFRFKKIILETFTRRKSPLWNSTSPYNT